MAYSDHADRQKEKLTPELRQQLYDFLNALGASPDLGRCDDEARNVWHHTGQEWPFFDVTYARDEATKCLIVDSIGCAVATFRDVHVFLSYCHDDAQWFEKLLLALAPLKRFNIHLWCDNHIPAGASWEDFIDSNVANAGAALLLVSEGFLRSTFIQEKEVGPFLKRAKQTTLGPFLVLWIPLADEAVILADALGKSIAVPDFQALVSPKSPLHRLHPRRVSTILAQVCFDINAAIWGLRTGSVGPPGQPAGGS